MNPTIDMTRGALRMPGGRARCHAYNAPARRGAIAYVMLLSLVFFMALFLLLMDIGRTTIEKIEMQNAADASAYSASLQLARGMNAITATNHHIGEMMSLVVLHKAIAGENVDGQDLSPSDLRADARYDRFLPRLAAGARQAGGWTSTFPEIARPLRAAETVGQAKLRLKGLVAQIYAQQIVYSLSPWTRWLVPVLSAFEAFVVLPEWLALDRMETIARATLPMRNLISRVLLPAARRYEDDVVRTLPDLAGETATAIADRNHCQGALYPARPSLPVEQESFDADDPDHARSMANTQIVRATFPWVNYHRSAVLSHTSWMILSGTSALYRGWTDNDTTERSRQFYLDQNSTIYVMQDSGRPLKGYEPWTSDPAEADRRFCVIGFAYRPTYRPFAAPAVKEQNRSGLLAYAQAIVYNANPQNPPGSLGPIQQEVGWDTLNWKSPVADSHAYEFPEGREGPPGPPLVQVNWQAKLVPATSLLDRAAEEVTEPFAAVIGRIVPMPRSLRTH